MKIDENTKLDILFAIIFVSAMVLVNWLLPPVDERCVEAHKVNPDPVTFCIGGSK